MSAVVECVACGHVGNTKSKGSTSVLVLLLLFFFPIGILYWLLNRGSGVCSACKSPNVKLYQPIRQQFNSTTSSPQRVTGATKLVANSAYSHNAGEYVKLDENNIEQKNCPDCRELIRFDARKCKHCGSMVEVA